MCRIAAGVIAVTLLTGCSSMRFIANGNEFKKICRDNGLQVQNASESLNRNQAYKSLTDAYLATASDGSYSIWYIRFSDPEEAQVYYDSVSGQMSGEEYAGSNYEAEVETMEDQSREIYMESGRIIYADGNTKAINTLKNQLIGTWSGDGVAGTTEG